MCLFDSQSNMLMLMLVGLFKGHMQVSDHYSNKQYLCCVVWSTIGILNILAYLWEYLQKQTCWTLPTLRGRQRMQFDITWSYKKGVGTTRGRIHKVFRLYIVMSWMTWEPSRLENVNRQHRLSTPRKIVSGVFCEMESPIIIRLKYASVTKGKLTFVTMKWQ